MPAIPKHSPRFTSKLISLIFTSILECSNYKMSNIFKITCPRCKKLFDAGSAFNAHIESAKKEEAKKAEKKAERTNNPNMAPKRIPKEKIIF